MLGLRYTIVLHVLYEGWCIKESGTQFLGKTNWKKRWFKLVQQIDNNVHLQYFRYKRTVKCFIILLGLCSIGVKVINYQLAQSSWM